MKKRLVVITICLLAILQVQAQELTVEYNFGFGTYAMGKLKDVLSKSEASLDHVKVTDNFPGYFVHQAKVGMDFKQMHHAGISVDYMNTVGNKGVSDYSGSYNFTIRTKGIRLGAFYRVTPKDWLSRVVRPYLQLSAGIILNNGDMEEKLVIRGRPESYHNLSLGGINSFVEPAVGCRIHLLSHLDLNVSAGYEIDLTKDFKDKSGLYDVQIYPDWSGLRLMGGLIYSIPIAHK